MNGHETALFIATCLATMLAHAAVVIAAIVAWRRGRATLGSSLLGLTGVLAMAYAYLLHLEAFADSRALFVASRIAFFVCIILYPIGAVLLISRGPKSGTKER